MTTTVTVEVTEKDIAEGEGKDCFRCPVAIAIRRAVGNPVSVGMVLFKVIGDAGKSFTGRLPECASNLVRSFDAFGEVKPISFPLDIPSEFVKAVQK